MVVTFFVNAINGSFNKMNNGTSNTKDVIDKLK